MAPDARSELRSSLGAEERLLWAGRPRQGVILRASDAFQIPFSIFWLGFSIFWTVAVVGSRGLFLLPFAVPFILIGLYLTFGRF